MTALRAIEPVLAPLAQAVRRTVIRIRLADTRWALSGIHPLHPDRHVLEGRAAQLERNLR